jgi:hypothetical protein
MRLGLAMVRVLRTARCLCLWNRGNRREVLRRCAPPSCVTEAVTAAGKLDDGQRRVLRWEEWPQSRIVGSEDKGDWKPEGMARHGLLG